jgi:phospholipase C
MSVKNRSMAVLRGARLGLATLALLQFSLFGPLAGSAEAHDHKGVSSSPIKHVIIIVGENRTFDHIFATYKPKEGEQVDNLLSKQIVKEDGTPGKNYAKAYQYSADVTGAATFQLSPTTKKTLYSFLPAPLNGGPTNVCTDNGICTLGDATSSENGLALDYYQYMLTGGSGLTGKVPDTRITGVHGSAPYSTLPPGPFQLTNSKTTGTFPYDAYAASPVHRFYQMFQQLDCNTTK